MMRSIAVILLLTMPFAALMAAGTEEELGPGLYAELTTNRGVMVFLLDPSNTPLAVANFCGLAEGLLPNDEKGPGIPYYDGLTFYREAPEYAVFSGDHQGTGTGGPGYTIPREPGAVISTESPGTLVMDGLFTESAGSRFFITIQGDPFLDAKYTAFGRIISGERVLKKLHRDDVLESVRIIRVGEQAQSFSFDKASFDELYASARDNEIDALGETNPALPEVIKALGDDMVKTYTGIYYQVLSEGEGEKPKSGSQVSMNYVGRLLNGTVFDSSIQRGQTFDFVLGRDGVIPGWIEMVSDMTTGESRRVVVPPHLAYGEQGLGPIEPNSWLIFDMELVGFVDG